jgi:hypothetical protein
MTPLARNLLLEYGFSCRKAGVTEGRVFTSHFPSNEVQDKTEVQ